MRVVINMNIDGGFEVATDEAAEVYVVCDHTPNDRVYRLGDTHMVSRAAVDAALRDDPVGHAGDERHAAASNRILSALEGKSHLRPVE